jgi:hypothetical protein
MLQDLASSGTLCTYTNRHKIDEMKSHRMHEAVPQKTY